jgi:hypothetical protein
MDYEDDYWELMVKVSKLATFILDECEGYPNNNHDALETAIQIIKDQKKELETKYKHNFTK